MHKTAVGYAIGKLMQVLGGVLAVPLGLALYDYRALPVRTILSQPEVSGFILSILLSVLLGSIMVSILRSL